MKILCLLSQQINKIIDWFLSDDYVEKANEFGEYLYSQISTKEQALIYKPASIIVSETIAGPSRNHRSLTELHRENDIIYLFDIETYCIYTINYTDLIKVKDKILENSELWIGLCYEQGYYDKFIKYCPKQIIKRFTKKEIKNLWKRYRKNIWNPEEIFNDL